MAAKSFTIPANTTLKASTLYPEKADYKNYLVLHYGYNNIGVNTAEEDGSKPTEFLQLYPGPSHSLLSSPDDYEDLYIDNPHNAEVIIWIKGNK